MANENILKFGELRPHFDGLLFNLERDLDRRGIALDSEDQESSRGYALLRIAALSAININNSVRFLCADTETQGRRPEYSVVVPILNRTLLETFVTIIYVLEDFPNRARKFHRAAWREQAQELQLYRTEFTGTKEWQPHLHARTNALTAWQKQFGITEAEAKDPKSVEIWKIGSGLFDEVAPANRSFVRWLAKWLYSEASSIAHFGPMGAVKIGLFLLAPGAPDQIREQVQKDALPKFKFFHIGTNLILLVAIATEMEVALNLGNKVQITKCWQLLRAAFPDAAEVCERRYEKLMVSW